MSLAYVCHLIKSSNSPVARCQLRSPHFTERKLRLKVSNPAGGTWESGWGSTRSCIRLLQSLPSTLLCLSLWRGARGNLPGQSTHGYLFCGSMKTTASACNRFNSPHLQRFGSLEDESRSYFTESWVVTNDQQTLVLFVLQTQKSGGKLPTFIRYTKTAQNAV